jgi:hypothetical protein
LQPMRELERVIIPEILDSLNPADPRAIRSRRDLRWIDLYLGNSRWIVRQLKKQTSPPAWIIEIGAGEGDLCRKVQTSLPSSTVTGLDLIQRPANLPSGIQWIGGDFFQTLPNIDADACIGSLILHHFSNEALRELGVRLQAFRSLTFCEPLRSRLSLFLSKLSSSFMSEVTRHDMPTSIRAGFRPGEIPALLGLDSKKWCFRESSHWRGALRLAAVRR